ncbi:MAG: c-type cytochrome domain-containing protein [Balneolaceae bacterium]
MKNPSLAVLLFVMIVGLSCTNNSENLVSAPDDTEEPNDPNQQVSFGNDVQPIFNSSCTSCHGNSGGVNLSSYTALMNSVGNNYGNNLVVPGDADASGLVDKVEPNPTHGTRMPIGGTLSSSQIQTIRAWINEGAQNN